MLSRDRTTEPSTACYMEMCSIQELRQSLGRKPVPGLTTTKPTTPEGRRALMPGRQSVGGEG